jgi:hypothetical protein
MRLSETSSAEVLPITLVPGWQYESWGTEAQTGDPFLWSLEDWAGVFTSSVSLRSRDTHGKGTCPSAAAVASFHCYRESPVRGCANYSLPMGKQQEGFHAGVCFVLVRPEQQPVRTQERICRGGRWSECPVLVFGALCIVLLLGRRCWYTDRQQEDMNEFVVFDRNGYICFVWYKLQFSYYGCIGRICVSLGSHGQTGSRLGDSRDYKSPTTPVDGEHQH